MQTAFGDFWFWFFVAATLGWLARGWQLGVTLKKMPVIHSHPVSTKPAKALVTVLIPARNEETNIRACVESLRAQDYPNLEILVANDKSTDSTEAILKELGVRYFNVPPTPEGWTGKNFALHHISRHAQGEWLLFTDADTRHKPCGISSVIQHVEARNLKMLTLLPSCLTGSFWENAIQPIAMALLGLWFPIQNINDPNSPVYFANGQFLLMHRDLYAQTGGHAAVYDKFLEDFALSKKAKALQAGFECALGIHIYGTRMYDSFDAIWRGWRRIYLHAFEQNTAVLILKTLENFLLSVAPAFAALYLLLTHHPVVVTNILAATLLTSIALISWRGYLIIEAQPAYVLLQPVATLILSGVLIDAAHIAALKKKTVWR